MLGTARRFFPQAALVALLGTVVWAVSLGTLPRADFTFINGTEIQSVDPARVDGSPEGRIIGAIFEGLYRPDPKTLEPQPAVASSHTLSEDGKTYTFTLRDDARWSDGTQVTAHDFLWSWHRMLHPETAAQYGSLLYYYVARAELYQKALVAVGDRVEVELADRRVSHELFPRGTMLYGQLEKIDKPPKPKFAKDASDEVRDKAMVDWKGKWIYTVSVDGRSRRFSKSGGDAEKCRHVLIDFQQVGIRAIDDLTLQVELKSPTPYFLYLAAFYPLYPVNRACIEQHGFPDWTRPENIVSNGPFTLEFRRIRDRVRMRKNKHYWDRDNVQLETVDALAVQSQATGVNMYLNGQVDWAVSPPSSLIPVLEKRADFLSRASLAIYFYRFNITRPPFDDPKKGLLIRRALNQAINKKEICERILKAGQQPARGIVPPGLQGYQGAQCDDFDLAEAKRLLAEAGFPGGRGLEPIEVLYNTSEGHREIAEVIGSNWEELGVKIVLRNLEWNSFLKTIDNLEFEVARSSWIGDYPDPNTFLDMFITGGTHNQTGWSNAEYDTLIDQAASEPDAQKRLKLLHDAEAILMRELPIIPIYSYVSVNLVKPYVRGFYSNSQNLHPLGAISIDVKAREAYRRRRAEP